MANNTDKLIVALDVPTLAEARGLVDSLGDSVSIYKVGSQLFTACGPAAVRSLEAAGKKVFLDLKFYDIPNTVAMAVSAAVSLGEAIDRTQGTGMPKKQVKGGLFMYTLHTAGGLEMMQAAVTSGSKQAEKIGVTKPLAIGVTVLTSEEKKDNIADLVLERSLLARKAGLDGVVASPQEAGLIRKELGQDFVIVTPGIRPAGREAGDQKRIATPGDAIRAGSNYLVVGRPIVKAENPQLAAKTILDEMAG